MITVAPLSASLQINGPKIILLHIHREFFKVAIKNKKFALVTNVKHAFKNFCKRSAALTQPALCIGQHSEGIYLILPKKLKCVATLKTLQI
jgi:hypothetical protein